MTETAALSCPHPWRAATIRRITQVTPRVKGFRLGGFDMRHRAGQYVDLRLTAPDGHRAERSYSIASAPGDPDGIELMIERLDRSEVSTLFDTVAEVGDRVEIRGPFGGSFVWAGEDGGPVLLLGSGSCIAPLLAMVRERALRASHVPMLLIYSARTKTEAIAHGELAARSRDETGFDLTLLLTREGSTTGRRVDRVMIDTAIECLGMPRHVYICGANPFVGTVSELLRDAGVKPSQLRTERFGG